MALGPVNDAPRAAPAPTAETSASGAERASFANSAHGASGAGGGAPAGPKPKSIALPQHWADAHNIAVRVIELAGGDPNDDHHMVDYINAITPAKSSDPIPGQDAVLAVLRQKFAPYRKAREDAARARQASAPAATPRPVPAFSARPNGAQGSRPSSPGSTKGVPRPQAFGKAGSADISPEFVKIPVDALRVLVSKLPPHLKAEAAFITQKLMAGEYVLRKDREKTKPADEVKIETLQDEIVA